MAMQTFGTVDVVHGAPSVREFDVLWPDGSDRDLTGLTPYLRVYRADMTLLVSEITGSVVTGVAQLTIPALDPPGTYYAELELRSGATVANDGRWVGVVKVAGRA